jgi:hypothetical protein
MVARGARLLALAVVVTPVALSYCYPPLRYPRSIQVARLLDHLEGEPTRVFCGLEADGDETMPSAAPPERVTRIGWTRAAVMHRKITNKVGGGRAQMPDPYLLWALRAARAIRSAGALADGPLVSFGQPMSDHLAALRLRSFGRPWIAHFSDPWSDSPYRRYGRVRSGLDLRMERAVAERADALVFTCAETADLVMSKYPGSWSQRAHVLPHAYDPAAYDGAVEPEAPLVIRYLGNFYGHRTPAPLFGALRELLRREPEALRDARVELIGSWEHPPAGDPAELPAGTVTIRPAVSYSESLRLMRSAGLLLLLDAPDDRGLFFPSKLVDYIGARRPIAALSPPGPAARLVGRIGGFTADPRDREAAADTLAEAIATARSIGAGDWGDPRVRAEYEAGVVAGRMDELIAAVS